MHSYLAAWAIAFSALVFAVFITAWIYRLMGDGLDLNGWLAEIIIALIVSAGQAGGDVLEQHLPPLPSYAFGPHGSVSIAGSIFLLCLFFGYKITHLFSWDPLEYIILGLCDVCLAFLAALLLM